MTATIMTHAWSCTMRLVIGDPAATRAVTADLHDWLERVDAAVSRFRPDSQLTRANANAGRPVPVSRLTVDFVAAALEAARLTDGAVDPTVGGALITAGYDRDLAEVVGGVAGGDVVRALRPSARWSDVRLDPEYGLLTVPAGTALDLGATAKAYAADRLAGDLHRRYATPVLVELGGDLAVRGTVPGGWNLHIAERADGGGQGIRITDGGVATSTTTLRTWRRGGRLMHHVLDPSTGLPVRGPLRTVTVHAPSALLANTASTAALVLGYRAEQWLLDRGLAARLVNAYGTVRTIGAWPATWRAA